MFLLDGLASSAVVLLAAVASLPVTQGAPSPLLKPLEERGGCNADNLLRLLRATDRLSDSLPFCSSYIGLPASTVTVATVTPTVTQSVTQTATGTAVFHTTPTVTVTVTTVSTDTEIVNETPTETSVATEVSTQTDVFSVTPSVTVTTQIVNIGTSSFTQTITVSTTITKAYGAAKLRRGTKQPLSDQVLSTYEPSRISSACSCLTIPVNTKYVTATASAATSTSIVSSSTETSVTVTDAAATSTATESSSTRTSLTVTADTVTVTTTVSLSAEVSLTLTDSTVTSITTELSSSETSVTTTTTTTLTSVSTLPSPPPQTPAGFFVRSYRVEADNFYMGNYYINRDASTTNKRQALTILASNKTAPRFDLTDEGYLKVLKSVAVGAAATGNEDQTYVAYRDSNAPSPTQLFFDKIATVQACATCTVLQFDMVTQPSKFTGQCKFLVLRNNPAPSYNFQVCGTISGVTYFSLWQSTKSQIAGSCFQMLMAVSQEGQSDCYGYY